MQLHEVKVNGTYYDYPGAEMVTVQEIDTQFIRYNCVNVIGEAATDRWLHPSELLKEKPDAEAQVKRGAAKLDTVDRGWYWDVDLDTLVMWDTWCCILGQIFGSFGVGEEALGLGPGEAESHGFFRSNDDYEELYDLWVTEILARRNGEIEIP